MSEAVNTLQVPQVAIINALRAFGYHIPTGNHRMHTMIAGYPTNLGEHVFVVTEVPSPRAEDQADGTP